MATTKIQTGLRLPEPTLEKLRTISVLEQRSLNNLIERIIQQFLDDYEAQHGNVTLPDGK